MIIKENYYILTGGPGVGKTTLINELSNRGFKCVAEVARQIIQDELNNGGNALPWANMEVYSRKMLEASVSDFIDNYKLSENLFFDRGVPDTLGYETLMKFSSNRFLEEMCIKLRYNKQVFLLPPWREIYENDAERKQDFEEATRTYDIMNIVYNRLEYRIIEIPLLAVDKRADFILNYLNL